jgi:hypothetical protein
VTELRRAVRMPASSPATLTWTENGGRPVRASARLRDVSLYGIRADAGRPVDIGTFVFFVDQNHQMSGGGYVRYCKRKLFRYQIGVEIKGNTTRPL